MELKTANSIYFIGIGGIGMSGLARYFNAIGKKVSGYDLTATPLTDELQKEGIAIHFEEDVEVIPKDVDLVVYTPAIPGNHAEYVYYKENRYPVLKRAEVLGLITRQSFTVAVAGTHGKTTTSSIIAHILKQSGADCAAFLGGITLNYNSNVLLPSPGSGERNKRNEVTVVEADEYDRSFLTLHPDIAVITAMDPDHLDIYGTPEAMQETFNKFASQVKKGGVLIAKNGLNLTNERLTYSVSEKADFYAGNIAIENGTYIYDFLSAKGSINGIRFCLPGRHNVENAVAATAVAQEMGVTAGQIKEALATYKGVKRRFEYIVKTDELVYIDDYAHHPEELRACISAVREMYPGKKITGIFQPHLYSRTRDFAEGFRKALSLLDELLLLPVYPAREKPIEGVTSEMLLPGVAIKNKKHCTKDELLEQLPETKPEVLLTLGAGDIDALVEPIKNLLLQ